MSAIPDFELVQAPDPRLILDASVRGQSIRLATIHLRLAGPGPSSSSRWHVFGSTAIYESTREGGDTDIAVQVGAHQHGLTPLGMDMQFEAGDLSRFVSSADHVLGTLLAAKGSAAESPGFRQLTQIAASRGLLSRMDGRFWAIMQPVYNGDMPEVVVGLTLNDDHGNSVDFVPLPPLIYLANQEAYAQAAASVRANPDLIGHAVAGKSSGNMYRRLGVPTLADLYAFAAYSGVSNRLVLSQAGVSQFLDGTRAWLTKTGVTHWGHQFS